MALALEQLGYVHCAHGFDNMDSDAYSKRWLAAVDAKYHNIGKPFTHADWDELLGHCAAVTDMPCVMFWRELVAAYPDAKILLVQRDEDKWFRSFNDTVIESLYSRSGTFTRNYAEPLLGSSTGLLCLKILEGYFRSEGPEQMRENARRVCREHYDDIRATIPKEKLLEYRLGSGWTPLCDFLGKEVPDVEFPWVNEADALKLKIEDYTTQKRNELASWLRSRVLPVLGTAMTAVAAYSLAKRVELV